MTSRTQLCLAAFVLALVLPASGPAQTTSTVIRVQGSLSALVRGGSQTVVKLTLTQNTLINLALDQPRTNAVPANEVLALAVDCESGNNPPRLIVYDTNSQSNLGTIATGVEDGTAGPLAKQEIIAAMEVDDVGGPSDGFAGGVLLLVGTSSSDSNGCPLAVSLGVSGILNAITTEPVTQTNKVLITKAKLSGARIGTLVE